MNELRLKATTIAFLLFSMMLSPSLSFADMANQEKIVSAKLGCMSCHQPQAVEVEKKEKKSIE